MRGGWIDSFCLPYSYSGWVDEPAFGLGGAEFSAFACALCTFVDRGGSSNRDGSDWIQLIHRNNNNNNKRYKFLATFTDTIKMNVLRWFQLWCVLNSQGVPSEYFVKFERISVVKNFSSLQYYVSLPISDSKGSSTQNVLTWTGHRDLKVPPPQENRAHSYVTVPFQRVTSSPNFWDRWRSDGHTHRRESAVS